MVSVAVDRDLESGGQRVHHGDTDTVQTARDGVRIGVELATGVELGEDDLDGGHTRGVHGDGDTATVVDDLDTAVGEEGDLDLRRVTGHGSSTELSTTSQIRWCRPRSPVEPMYIPGRLRTASRPSRTVMDDAPYSFLLLFDFWAATGG